MATAAHIELNEGGLPVVVKTWELTREAYYEQSGINRQTRLKRRWNKGWMLTPEFHTYLDVAKGHGAFTTSSVQSLMTTVRAFAPAMHKWWEDKTATSTLASTSTRRRAPVVCV